jgi:hypothetical protein
VMRLLRRIGDLITSPLGKAQFELQESLASNWVAIKLRVERGDIDPGASIYVPELQPGRGSGYLTVRSVLKTVQDDWGQWDRKTMAWWCEVLDRTSKRFGPRPITPSRKCTQGGKPRFAP